MKPTGKHPPGLYLLLKTRHWTHALSPAQALHLLGSMLKIYCINSEISQVAEVLYGTCTQHPLPSLCAHWLHTWVMERDLGGTSQVASVEAKLQ